MTPIKKEISILRQWKLPDHGWTSYSLVLNYKVSNRIFFKVFMGMMIASKIHEVAKRQIQ